MNMKRILAVWLAAGAITCWTAAQTSNNAEEKAEHASQAKKDKEANVKITKGPTVEYASADKAVIAWSTNEPSGTLLHYGTDRNNLSQTAQAPWGGTTHRVDLKNLQANTNYFFKFESEHGEGTGTEAESQIFGFRTPASNAQAIHEQPAMTADQLQAQGGAPAASATASTPAAASTAEVQKEPLYRLTSSKDRLYTTSSAEMNRAKALGYNFEGIAGYVATSQTSGTSPLYRLTKSASGKTEHFYTASAAEMQNAVSKLGFVSEGVIGYVPTTQLPGTVPLERLVQQSTGEYLYTTSAAEKQQAVSRDHYQDQGVACYVWQS